MLRQGMVLSPFQDYDYDYFKNIHRSQLVLSQKLTFLALLGYGLGILTVSPLFNPLHAEYLPASQKSPLPFPPA